MHMEFSRIVKGLQGWVKYSRIAVALLFLICVGVVTVNHSALAKEGNLLIKGDGFVVTSEEVRQIKSLLSPRIEIDKKDLLDLILGQQLFAMEAVRLGLDKDRCTAARLELAHNKILADAFWRQHVVPRININDDVLLSYYKANQDKFTVPGQVHLLWVVSSDLQTLEGIKKGLKAGAKINNLVRSAQVCRIPLLKGPPYDIGWRRLDEMPKQLQEAISTVQKGGTTEPLSFGGLYYLFYVEDRRDKEILPFSKVKRRIKEYMVSRKRQEIRQNILVKLKSQYHVKLIGTTK